MYIGKTAKLSRPFGIYEFVADGVIFRAEWSSSGLEATRFLILSSSNGQSKIAHFFILADSCAPARWQHPLARRSAAEVVTAGQ